MAAHFCAGDFDKAIDAEKRALKLLSKNIEIYKKRLSKMEINPADLKDSG